MGPIERLRDELTDLSAGDLGFVALCLAALAPLGFLCFAFVRWVRERWTRRG